MNEVLKKLYENGLTVFDLPDYEQFQVDMQDEEKLSKFRENMSQHFDIPDLETLKFDIGFEAKDDVAPQMNDEGLTIPVPEVTDEVNTERVGLTVAPGESFISVDEDITNEDITPQGDVETITENVKYDEKETGGNFDITTVGESDTITYDSTATPFERSLAFINRDLFTRDEEPVVNRLNYHFNDYGFAFEESGVFDNVTVTASNGAQEQFAIDSWFTANNSQEARALRDFLRKNQESSNILAAQTAYDSSKKKYFTAQARLDDIKLIQQSSQDLVKRNKEYFERQAQHEQNMEIFTNAQPNQFDDPEFAAQYQRELEEGRYLASQAKNLNQEFTSFRDNAKSVDYAVGAHVAMKENDGTAVGTAFSGMYNQFVGYFDQALSTIGGTGIEAFYNVAQGYWGNNYGMSEEEYRTEFIRVYEGYKNVEAPDSAKESEEGFIVWMNSLKDINQDDSQIIKDIMVENGMTESDLRETSTLMMPVSGMKPKGLIDGDHIIVEDPGLRRLPSNEYDISKGVRYNWGNDNLIPLGQPSIMYDKPQVWSIEEDDWVDAPNIFNITNLYEQIDDLVGDQLVKKSKKAFKSKSRDFFTDLIGVQNVSEERVEAQMNAPGASGIIMTGLYGGAESLPALIPMIYGAIKKKKLILPKGKKAKKFMKRMGQSIKAWATDGYRQTTLISMALMHADKLNQRMEQNPEFEWVTEEEKKAIVLPLAITSGILESLGFRNLLAGKSGTQFLTNITTQALAKLPKGATPQMFRVAVVNIMDNRLTRGLKNSAVGRFGSRVIPAALAEAETGALQEMSDIGGTNLYNSFKGKEMFKNPDLWSKEYFNQVGRSAAAEAVGGFALSTGPSLVAAFTGKKGLADTVITDEMVAMFNNLKNDKTYVEGYKTKLEQEVAQGLKSKAKAKAELLVFNVLRSAAIDIDVASDLSPTQLANALKLVFQKKQLTNELEGLDPDLGVYKEKQIQLDNIKLLLNEIGSSEATSQAALSQEQEGIVDFVTEEEAESKLIEEGVENPTPEQIKTKQDALQKQSTEILDAQESSEDSSEMGENVSNDNTTDKSGKTIKGIQTENEGQTEEEVDSQEKEDVEQFFDETNESNEIVTPSISRNKGKTPVNRNTGLVTQIIKNTKKVAESIKKIFPKSRFVLHDNSELFTKATGKKGKGFFDTDSGTIHINLEKASKSTVYHEVSHAIANELIKNDAAANKVFGRLLKSIDKVLPAQAGNLRERINKFTEKYEANEVNEEAFSELLGILAGEYKTLTKPKKSKVKDLIARFLRKLGIKVPPVLDTLNETDENVIDFLNTLAQKVRSGEEVTETDLKVITDLTTEMNEVGTAPIGDPTTIVNERKGKEQKVSFDGVYANSLITPANELDIDALVEDIANKKQKVWFWMADQLGIGTVDGVKIDGGPSYAFVPENEQKNIIWASGMSESALARNSKEADYIFIVSGSPKASKLANKKVYDLFISKLGSFEEFKTNVSNFAKPPIKAVKDILAKYDSWDAIKNAKSNTVRKTFLTGLVASEQTPNTDLHKLLKDSDAFIDLESLRDGFYKANNFKMNDIMLVLKPTGAGQQSNHSTYTNDILGDVVGVPNKLINAYFLLPAAMRDKYGKVLSGAQQSQVLAPYGSGIRNVESQTKKSKPEKKERKGKEQKSERDIQQQTGMPDSGFYSAQAMVSDIQRQWQRINPGYTAVRAKQGAYGGGGGVFVLRPNGSRVKFKSGKLQKLDSENTIIDIVMRGREAGFKDSALKFYAKKRGFAAKLINDAMALEEDLFTNFPKSFANIAGGLKNGVSLLRKVNDEYIRLTKINNKKRKNKVSNEQIVNDTIEFMYNTPEYKEVGTDGSKKTSQQMAMEVDILNYLSPDTSAKNGLRVLNLNKDIRNIKWSNKEGKRIQRKLRQYIRSVIPRGIYGKSDIMKMIDKVNAVDESNFEVIVEEIIDEVTIRTNKSLNDTILNILNKDQTTKQSGRLKGKSISNAIRKRILSIQKNIIGYVPGKKNEKGKIILKKDITADEITAQNQKLLDRISALETEDIQGISVNRTLTPKEMETVADLGVAIAYNNTLLMDMKNAKKTNGYEQVLFGLNQLQDIGVSSLQLQLLKDSSKYMNDAITVLKDMGVTIDPLQALKDSGQKNISQADLIKKFLELKKKVKIDASRSKITKLKVQQKIVQSVKVVTKKLYAYLGTAEDLTGLMDRISLSTGELFGGVTQDLVTKEIRMATRTFKGRMLRHELAVATKMTELFGNKWMKSNRQNSIQDVSIIISESKENILQREKARIEKDSKMESGEKVLLLQEIDKEINSNTKVLSQNELLYYRNQGLDPSLVSSFDSTFEPTPFAGSLAYLNTKAGFRPEYSERIKEEITTKLDSKLIDLGDWMVNDFYPSQYEHYNKTYQKIYRTDMPWNKYYAGRLYRDGEQIGGIDLLDSKGNDTWMNSVSTASTKYRQESKASIMQTNAVDALLNYTRDMEYFAAYALPIRNINKIFTDSAVRETIAQRFGEPINKYINNAIQKVANKGVNNEGSAGLINFFNNSFLLSRLGFNPTLILKQMTSAVTYGNEIGYDQWLKYSAQTGIKGISNDLKEIMANSVVLQDRYGQPITRVLESYQDRSFQKLNGEDNAINKLFNKENQNKLVNLLMSFTMAGDKGAIMLGGLPNYRYYKAQYFSQNENATDQEAVEYAIRKFEDDTLRTQQSYDLQDKDYYQTSNAFARALNMFLTTPKQYLRKEIIAFRNFSRLVRSGKKQGKGTYYENLRTLFIYHSVMPTLFKFVSMGAPGLLRDRREGDMTELSVAGIMGNLNALFIIGKITDGLKDTILLGNKFGERAATLPVLDQAARLNYLFNRWTNTKDEVKKAEARAKLFGEMATTVGIPAPQLMRMFDNYRDLSEGSFKNAGDAFLKLFNFSDYSREGKKTKTSKKRSGLNMTQKEMQKYFPEEYREQQREKREYELENADYFRELEEMKKEQKLERQQFLDDMYLD